MRYYRSNGLQLIQHSFDTIEKNIAWDETALTTMKSGRISELIRLWQVPRRSVVIGRSQQPEKEVFLHACHRDRVPVIRRFSGGGAVLQGPEVMNYTFILDLNQHSGLSSIRDYFSHCLGIVTAVLRQAGIRTRIRGHSDLADAHGRKISGNALAVRGNALCVHGTLILAPITWLCEKYLRYPSSVPEYRAGRQHETFITAVSEKNSTLDIRSFREILIREHNLRAVNIHSTGINVPEVSLLGKYCHPMWNNNGKHPQGDCAFGKTA